MFLFISIVYFYIVQCSSLQNYAKNCLYNHGTIHVVPVHPIPQMSEVIVMTPQTQRCCFSNHVNCGPFEPSRCITDQDECYQHLSIQGKY